MDALNGVSSAVTPNQSMGAFSKSTQAMSGMIGGLANLGNMYGNIGEGVAKQVGATALNMAQGGENIATAATKPLLGENANLPQPQAQQQQQMQQAMQPSNIPQRVGNMGASVGEMFIPGGAEEDVLSKAAPYIDKLPDLVGISGKAASATTNALKLGLSAVVGGTSMGGVTAAQTGDPSQTVEAAELGSVAAPATEALKIFGPDALTAINKAGFKLTPSQEAKTQKVSESAAQFMTDNKITGSDSAKARQLTGLTSNLEGVLQKSLPDNVSVPKQDIISSINQSVESLKNSDPAVYSQARTKANEAIDVLNSAKSDSQFTKGGTISVKDALSGKRSWGQMAFKTAQKGKSDPTVSNEGAYAVEQAYQGALEDTLNKTGTNAINIPSSMQQMFGGKSQVNISEFNSVYKNAINAKNLTNVAQFKNDAGLFGRMFGLLAGRMVGNAILPGVGGEVVGMGVGEMAANKGAALSRRALEKGVSNPNVPINVTKFGQGVSNSLDQ